MNKVCTQLKSFGWMPHTILDIGAYKGNWTRETRLHFPNAKFVLIEPNDSSTLRSMKDRIFNEIVSDSVKQVQWFSNGSTGDSMFQERTQHYANVSPTLRTTTTLDILFPKESFDFIKIDCQGAELDILKGGDRLLRNTEVLLLECPFAGQYNHGAPTFADYIRKVDDIGFTPYEIVEHHYANGILCQIDILFIRKTSRLWVEIQRKIQ
jgi:FkbM family methyltransferase